MSFILKALKKLEEEKAALQQSPRDINRAILAPEQTPLPGHRTAVKIAVMVLILVVGCGAAYIIFRHDPQIPFRAQSPQDTTPREENTDRTRTTLSDPMPSRTEHEKSVSAGPGNRSNNVEVNASRENGKAAEVSPPRRPQEGLQSGAERPGREPTGPVPAGLKVSGIALQDDPTESVAVVNGMLVRRGMTVQDLRVDEIYTDRVKFSGNGQVLEVYITR